MANKPFTDVEMMILSNISYMDFGSQYFNSDGSAKRELNLGEILKKNKIVDTLYKTFDDSVVDSFLKKADQYTIVKSYVDPNYTGFAAIAIEGPEKGTVTVATRGTEKEAADWVNDAQLASERETMQQRMMNSFMKDFKSYDSIYLTGHSLGGNLAVSGAVGFDDPNKIKGIFTFNAPGQNAAYILENQENIKKIKGKVTNYQNEGDFVSDINIPVGKVVVVESRVGDKFEWTEGFINHKLYDMKYTKDGFKVSKNGKALAHKISQAVSATVTSAASGVAAILTTWTPLGIYLENKKNKKRDEYIAANLAAESQRIFMDTEGLRAQAQSMLSEQLKFDIVARQLQNLVITLKDDHVWDSPATTLFIENYLELHKNFTMFSEALKEYSGLMKSQASRTEGLDEMLAGDISKITM